MERPTKNKQILTLLFIAAMLLLLLLAIVIVFRPGENLFNAQDINTEALQKDYSNINEIVPGESTLQDVININGEPLKTEQKNNKTYLYYPTPFEEEFNYVVIKENIVEYSLENVYGDYRQDMQYYVGKYGDPDLELSRFHDYALWSVFLDEGIMIASRGNRVVVIVYFVPQDEELFLNGIAKGLELSKAGEYTEEDVLENTEGGYFE